MAFLPEGASKSTVLDRGAGWMALLLAGVAWWRALV
jgi:hypothetical protein